MSFFLVETANYAEAGLQTALISPCILLVMWKIFMTQERVQFHQAFPPLAFSALPSPPSQAPNVTGSAKVLLFTG